MDRQWCDREKPVGKTPGGLSLHLVLGGNFTWKDPSKYVSKLKLEGSFQAKCPQISWKDWGSFPVTSLMVHSVRASSFFMPIDTLLTWQQISFLLRRQLMPATRVVTTSKLLIIMTTSLVIMTKMIASACVSIVVRIPLSVLKTSNRNWHGAIKVRCFDEIFFCYKIKIFDSKILWNCHCMSYFLLAAISWDFYMKTNLYTILT